MIPPLSKGGVEQAASEMSVSKVSWKLKHWATFTRATLWWWMGQSFSKSAGPVGCSWYAVISTYKKWFKEGQQSDIKKGHDRPKCFEKQDGPVYFNPTKEVLCRKMLKAEALAVTRRCQNTKCPTAWCLWGEGFHRGRTVRVVYADCTSEVNQGASGGKRRHGWVNLQYHYYCFYSMWAVGCICMFTRWKDCSKLQARQAGKGGSSFLIFS